jgi:hypothetical protein
MRARTPWVLIAAVNVLWAAAFFGYIHRSTAPVMRGGEIVRKLDATNSILANSPALSQPSKPGTNTTTAAHGTNSPAPSALPKLAPAGRQFGWQDVTNEVYKEYIARLRIAGAPEKQIRSIVANDVNELMDKRRLEHAVRNDRQWWKADSYFNVFAFQAGVAAPNFDQDRRELIESLLGPGWEETIKLPATPAGVVPLGGQVLGALPADAWNNVQDVCVRARERADQLVSIQLTEGKPTDAIETAKLRDFTRTELTKILSPEQLEEFLLRYSHNSEKLRQDMRGVDLTPEEFRKIFRAIDPVEHQLQLNYGGLETLSQKQREQYEAQRERAIREALTPERYQQFQLTKDPLYKQAQMTAMNYGMNNKAIQPLYELQKNFEGRRIQVAQNTALTPEQRNAALNSIAVEHQQEIQRIISNAAYRGQ